MARLIALDMPASKTFVDLVQRAWSNGDAVLPIDQRLPLAGKKMLLDAMAPSEIIDASFTASTLPNGRPMQDGDALVIASSGSTGSPKGIIHTHSSILSGAQASASRLQLSASDHWLVCIPVSHVGGFSVIARALHTGAALTLLPAFDVAAVQAAAKNGATHTSLVATALSRIDNSLFKSILLGGSSAPDNLPSNVITTYGMTETVTHIAIKKLNNFNLIPESKNKTLLQAENDFRSRHAELISASHYKTLPNVKISIDSRNCLVIDAPKICDKKI